MAPYVPAPGVAQFDLVYLWRNLPAINSIYVRKPTLSAWNTAELSAMALVIRNWWTGNMRAHQSNEISLTAVKGTDLTTQTGPTTTLTALLPIAGTIAAESVQNAEALVVKFGTAGRGRSARGRNYVPGLISSVLVDNHFNSVSANAVRQTYADLGTDISDESMTHVVVSRFTLGAPRATALSQPVTSYELSSLLVGIQRERRR